MEMEFTWFSNLWWSFECEVCSAYKLFFATCSLQLSALGFKIFRQRLSVECTSYFSPCSLWFSTLVFCGETWVMKCGLLLLLLLSLLLQLLNDSSNFPCDSRCWFIGSLLQSIVVVATGCCSSWKVTMLVRCCSQWLLQSLVVAIFKEHGVGSLLQSIVITI
jgi:hypothetical protein